MPLKLHLQPDHYDDKKIILPPAPIHTPLSICLIKRGMRIAIILILIFFSYNHKLNGQTKNIRGRVISEYMETLPMVRIQSIDTVLIGDTDINGQFAITIPQKIDKLLLSWIGMEWITIQLSPDCNNLEIIMMYDAYYDFMSSKKIDRLRKKRFEKLPELHQLAFNKGLFKTDKACFKQDFVPLKPRLDEIHDRIKKTQPIQ